MLPDKFNIRVYGVVTRRQKVLLVKENLRGFEFVKFPGGGVELGEGIFDALNREMMEELNTTVKNCSHFYTTDFFQVSAFKKNEQIISIYYNVELTEYPENGKFTDEPEHSMQFFWCDFSQFTPDLLTFPIDKKVALMLMQMK